MNDDLTRSYRRWLEADESGSDDDADAACRTLFQAADREEEDIVPLTFTSRTMQAISAAAVRDAEAARRTRTGLIAGSIAGGVLIAYFTAGAALSFLIRALIWMFDVLVGLIVRGAAGAETGASVWSVFASLGRAASAFVADPTVTFVLLGPAGAGDSRADHPAASTRYRWRVLQMKRWMTVIAGLMVALAGVALVAQETPLDEQQRALRSRVEARFDVVPITDGIALTPKTRMGDVRLIEVSDRGIAINGTAVTGSELRERAGSDADSILRLSYLDSAARRALFAPAPSTTPPGQEPQIERPREREPEPPRIPRSRESHGDRVRVFGDVNVAEDEDLGGSVVAVLGSVRIDGEVGQEVVAVLGSVDLGPKAVVRGDVVSVGGQIRRSPTAQIRGSVTEVSVDGVNMPDVDVRWGPFPWWWHNGFGAVPRLVGSGFRLLLLILLTGVALLLARPTVESAAHRLTDDGLKSTIVGVAAWILIPPMMLIGGILLAISIIGIPVLLFLMPFTVLALIIMALLGFAGAASAVGQWMRRRFGLASQPGFPDVVLGVIVILLPLLIGRLIAVAGWPVSGLALLLIVSGIALEFLAWTAGFGAVLTNGLSRWQARRAARVSAPLPPVQP